MTNEEAIEVLKLVDENASCDDCLYYAQMEDCPTDEDCIIRQALDMAIQVLSQEPTDAISREAVCDILEDIRDCISVEGYWAILERLKKLPPVTQKSGKWIPVSERLPEDGRYVLFCDIDNDIMVGYHVQGRPDTHFSQDGTWEDMKNVKAWMPLPEPYEPQESEEQTE